jgi:tRNA 2-thiouridine synthesizing protein E
MPALEERHWKVIHYLRRKLTDERTVPYFVIACMENGLRVHEFRALFPSGYHRGACRIAGVSYAALVAADPTHTYELKPFLPPRYPVGPSGFLTSFDAWDEEFAATVGREAQVPSLTERHREVMRYLRSFFSEQHAVPLVYETCRAMNLSLDELYQLFPGGYRRGACRMAGLPLVP